MGDRRRRSPLRLLAPLALVLFIVALFGILTSSGVEDDGGSRADTQAEQADLGTETQETTTSRQRGNAADRRESQLPSGCYVVRSGDTLAGIGEKNGLSADALQELNPALDPQALVSGQQVNLTEQGCEEE